MIKIDIWWGECWILRTIGNATGIIKKMSKILNVICYWPKATGRQIIWKCSRARSSRGIDLAKERLRPAERITISLTFLVWCFTNVVLWTKLNMQVSCGCKLAPGQNGKTKHYHSHPNPEKVLLIVI